MCKLFINYILLSHFAYKTFYEYNVACFTGIKILNLRVFVYTVSHMFCSIRIHHNIHLFNFNTYKDYLQKCCMYYYYILLNLRVSVSLMRSVLYV